MKISFALAFALAVSAAPSLAQDVATPASATPAAADIKRGAIIAMTDGRRIGRVDRIRDDSVGIIYNGKYVLLPISSLSASPHGLTTSLTKAELGAL